jgi:di/tricarboxylate transporter
MLTLPLGETGSALLALGIVVAMFIMFVRERVPAEVTALTGAALMLLFGLVPYDMARDVLSNPAPWTILAMFLIMGGLVRTGALDWLTKRAERQVDDRPLVTLSVLFVFVAIASAFMNNTPVVVVMIPVFIQVAKKLGLAPSKLLIPLSYAAILGGR